MDQLLHYVGDADQMPRSDATHILQAPLPRLVATPAEKPVLVLEDCHANTELNPYIESGPAQKLLTTSEPTAKSNSKPDEGIEKRKVQKRTLSKEEISDRLDRLSGFRRNSFKKSLQDITSERKREAQKRRQSERSTFLSRCDTIWAFFRLNRSGLSV